MMNKKRFKKNHKRCSYLNNDENDVIIGSVDSTNGSIIACSVVQIYLTQEPDHTQWLKYHTGLICFVKDFSLRSYFFRLYDLNGSMQWQHEMYNSFEYCRFTSNFHYFAAETCNVGLNFAYKDEAQSFYRIVYEKAQSKISQTPLAIQPVTLYNSPQEEQVKSKSSKGTGFKKLIKGIFNSEKNELNKLDISQPTDYRHLQHIGINSKSKNYDFSLMDEDKTSQEIFKFFQDSNFPCNKNDIKFAQDFIEKNGGLDEFKKHLSVQHERPPEIHPPPPPPLPSPLSIPLHISNKTSKPPPPPPPPLSIPVESGFNDQPKESYSQAPNAVEDTRSNLLDSIKAFQGFSNKKISHKKEEVKEESNTIVDQLRRALEERRQVIKDSDDENENINSSDSEW